jgi:hypothetical protein
MQKERAKLHGFRLYEQQSKKLKQAAKKQKKDQAQIVRDLIDTL